MIACTPEARSKLKAEIERLATARHHLYNYVEQTVLTNNGYVNGTHIRTICDTIEDFLQSDRHGLVISLPPRHMKSTIGSECLPAWWLSNHPQGEVIIASYNQSQARKMSRACRQRFDGETHRRIWSGLSFSVDAVDEFQLSGKTNGRPSLIAAGVGSGLTGSGGDLVIIDDPVKNMEDADSATIRNKTYDWYTSVASTRLSPGGHIILIMTRWHHDDLAGRILTDDADDWQVLNLPAIDGSGCALWPERFTVDDLMRKKAAMGSRVFEALYQGHPTPLEGGAYKRQWFTIVDRPFPPSAQRCRYWDKAATQGGGDYTTGVLMAEWEGRYCVEDVIHVQASAAEVQRMILACAQHDGLGVRIRMEQEPGSAGVETIDLYARRILQGFDFREDKVTGSKSIRSGPLEAAYECGNVDLLRGMWNRDYIEEMCEFPLGKHDDQVDASSGAFHELSNTPPQRLYFM